MKAVLGFLAIIAVAHASVVQLLPSSTATLVRTPSLDSAVVHSERLGGAFSYRTLENHAYAPVVRSYYYPQYQPVYYPQPVYQIHPAYVPTLGGLPTIPGIASYPSFGGVPFPAPAPGVNPQNPVEVESPADNAGISVDEDTVTVESA